MQFVHQCNRCLSQLFRQLAISYLGEIFRCTVKSFTWRWLTSLWKVIRPRLEHRPSEYLQCSLHNTYQEGFQSGVATLPTLSVLLTYCHIIEYGGQWPYSVPANLTTSISTVVGRNLSALCRSVGITLVKETFWGQIAFPHDTCGGVVCPLFYLEIFSRTSIFSTIIMFTFSFVISKFSSIVRLFFLFIYFLVYIGTIGSTSRATFGIPAKR